MTFCAISQNIMFYFYVPIEKIQDSINDPQFSKETPLMMKITFPNMRLIFLAFLIVSASTLVSAIGLLKRKNWARQVFIALMVIGIASNLGGLVIQIYTIVEFAQPPPGATQETIKTSSVANMMILMMLFSIIIAVGFSILFAWIIKRLLSEPIRNEFLT